MLPPTQTKFHLQLLASTQEWFLDFSETLSLSYSQRGKRLDECKHWRPPKFFAVYLRVAVRHYPVVFFYAGT
jgi:hypothetical protein